MKPDDSSLIKMHELKIEFDFCEQLPSERKAEILLFSDHEHSDFRVWYPASNKLPQICLVVRLQSENHRVPYCWRYDLYLLTYFIIFQC